MDEMKDTLKKNIQSFIYNGGFHDLLDYLATISHNNDKAVFGHSLSSIYTELSIIQRGMKKRKSISDFINTWMRDKNIQRPSYIYNRGNIKKEHWRKLTSGVPHEPELKTLYKLAIAFELTIEETHEFLLNFNRTFAHDSNMTDQIVSYFIANKIYEPSQIDAMLHEFGEATLFSDE
ncbi:hypothetical protein MHB42_17390 [Lysinibacillus sp. FSL K6-0232]|uniref:hypothetical protein n=1 Tax=Lysinibacillus sp. FSL K6-0232 TaxID=2921425 RepID=UPI0030F807D1